MSKKIFKIVLLSFCMLLVFSNVAYAKTKKNKKIPNVSIKVDSNIVLDTRVGEEFIEVNIKSDKYKIEDIEVLNDTFFWTNEISPKYKITLEAIDGYEFSIKKSSDIKISGAKYQSYRTENSRKNLVITVNLPALRYQLNPIEEVKLSEDGKLEWSLVMNAGSYEVKFYRGQSLIDGIKVAKENKLDLREFMLRQGVYSFRVRAINKYNKDLAGSWYSSNVIDVSIQDAQKNIEWVEQNNKGHWREFENKKWKYILDNGKILRNEWKRIAGEWYYFDDASYMFTGWLEHGGKWYYFDKESGKMLKNTRTPDGYFVSFDGSWIKD